MGPMTLHSRWSERLLAPIICYFVAGLGLYLALFDDQPYGWWLVGLGGVFAAMFTLRAIFAKSFRLEIDEEGFTTINPWRIRRILWRNIAAMGIHSVKGGRWVAWQVVDGAPGRQSDMARSIGGGWDQQLESRYGKTEEELLALLERYWKAACT